MAQRLHHSQTRSHNTEGWKDASENNKWMIVQSATFSKSLNPRNIYKSISDIRIRIRFPFERSFWISVSGCKLTILPDIQPANRLVVISAVHSLEGHHLLQPWKPIRKLKKCNTLRTWKQTHVCVWSLMI